VLGGHAVGVVLDFVVALVELDRLTALADKGASDLQVLEGVVGWAEFGAGVALDAAESEDNQLMLGVGTDVGIEMASFDGSERTA
jgi:hypothetical protein